MRYLIAETSWTLMSLAQELKSRGTLLTRTDSPEDVPHYLQISGVDLLVLDAATIGRNGLSLSALRAARPAMPIALIATKPQPEAIASWLDAGADAVIAAEATMEEIIARLVAVARRSHGLATSQLSHGPLTVDVERRRVRLNDSWLHLTPKVYELLEFLALRAGSLVTREALLNHIYGLEGEPDARVFDVYMCTLRSQLKPADGQVSIQTARGAGFRFISTAEGVAEAA